MKNEFIFFIQQLQNELCSVLGEIDTNLTFKDDFWTYPQGGNSRTYVISKGNVFEKGAVNTFEVQGDLPEIKAHQFGEGTRRYMACGISLVIHSFNPFVPTIHANFRYFELYDHNGYLKDSWFDGGVDLTPFYLEEKDGSHFHRTFKNACDPFGVELYPVFKKKCDENFIDKQRNEARGIGGIFYEFLRPNKVKSAEEILALSKAIGNALIPAYLPLVLKNKDIPYTEHHHRNWQAYRRGRYVEFSLMHDRGTLLGFETSGHTEPIFIRLPPVARWEYDFYPLYGSPEAQLVEWLKPRDWINI
ncbi:oxygen-dependent coproporphyrinogen oxidase [Chryseobacterium sp. ISL-6]|nr:oxygen-dependent coproporphyrinogen oxidase [Chryseobacterium sp. ISL-6]